MWQWSITFCHLFWSPMAAGSYYHYLHHDGKLNLLFSFTHGDSITCVIDIYIYVYIFFCSIAFSGGTSYILPSLHLDQLLCTSIIWRVALDHYVLLPLLITHGCWFLSPLSPSWWLAKSFVQFHTRILNRLYNWYIYIYIFFCSIAFSGMTSYILPSLHLDQLHSSSIIWRVCSRSFVLRRCL